MDVIKASLIIGIGITLYYLLLQWPIDNDVYDSDSQEQILINTFSDSERLLSEPLAPLSQASQEPVGVAAQELNYFEIQNNDLSLLVESRTGRFEVSSLKNISEEKGSKERFNIFGKTYDANSGRENVYFANSGFYTRTQGYLNPQFEKITEQPGEGNLKVYILEGASGGLNFSRKIEIENTGYSVKIEDSVNSVLGEDISITPYVVIERDGSAVEEGGLMYTYLGPVFSSTKDTYEKYDFDDIRESSYQNKSVGGWVALIQHYFLSAWIPNQNEEYLYQGRYGENSGRYSLGYTSIDSVLSYGETVSTENTLYVGPKLPKQLVEIEENLDLTVDYGFLWWLGKPMYWFLDLGYSLFNNWGLAIIFLTVALKLLTWPLSAKAYVSMGKMRELAPKMQLLQEKHGDNRQAMSQELMEVYKKEGVNPLGGCLPMLAQMPFFLAFYWVLLETVELRHSPFFLWIDDLSAMDPYFILPILNGAGMYLSQKLTPTPPNADPMQAQMMKFFPLIFAVIFAWFPSGLVLYWLVNMIIQIFQQWWYSRGTKQATGSVSSG
ncbi:membrane protein insertase YidC [Gammaproteobacteria bacterium]|nr:membrane protein insertase YidC [Gammaproteobacteria bacterium]